MPKRPRIDPVNSASTSSGEVTLYASPPRRPRLSGPDAEAHDASTDSPPARPLLGLKLIILDQKLLPTETIFELRDLAQVLGADIVQTMREAEVIITRIGAELRLERHVALEEARKKAIVKPDWLRACQSQLPSSNTINKPIPFAPFLSIRSLKPLHPHYLPPAPSTVPPPIPVLPATVSDDPRINHKARFCTHRLSPLVCPNQELVEELEIIRKHWEFSEDDKDGTRARAYGRGIAGVKALPKKLKLNSNLNSIPNCGGSITTKIKEYLQNSSHAIVSSSSPPSGSQSPPSSDRQYHIPLVRTILSTPKFRTLELLTSIHEIGAVRARDLYEKAGIRSVDELRGYDSVGDVMAAHAVGYQKPAGAGKATKGNEILMQRAERMGKLFGFREAVDLCEELNTRMPRSEVEDIAHEISSRLEETGEKTQGFEWTICGGYRRGKPTSADVDIVITQRGASGKDISRICTTLVTALMKTGLITHFIKMARAGGGHSQFNNDKANPGKKSERHAGLDTAFTICKLPGPDQLHRRVDLIFAPWDTYGTAVVGWTGSKQFEKDIRNWSKEHCDIHFDSSGMVRLSDTLQSVLAHSEREVFEILDLPWIDPTMRNADV